jgi:hypothetical protein
LTQEGFFGQRQTGGGAITHRTRIAAIPIGKDEFVVSIDEHGRIDLRLWTMTGDMRFPSGKGFSLPRHLISDLIAALMMGPL